MCAVAGYLYGGAHLSYPPAHYVSAGLTFLLSGAGSQTLVVALYYAVFAAGMRPIYSVDAMAMIYMIIVLLILLVVLRFVRPTQMVFRLDRR